MLFLLMVMETKVVEELGGEQAASILLGFFYKEEIKKEIKEQCVTILLRRCEQYSKIVEIMIEQKMILKITFEILEKWSATAKREAGRKRGKQ